MLKKSAEIRRNTLSNTPSKYPKQINLTGLKKVLEYARFPRSSRFGWETAKKSAETPYQTPQAKTLPGLGVQNWTKKPRTEWLWLYSPKKLTFY